jgi:hypothetical protein
MELNLFVAGCLTWVLGVVHSVLGEILIFRRMRKGGIIPTHGGPVLGERQVRILWASWHLVTVFGCGLGAILLRHSLGPLGHTDHVFVGNTIMFSMFLGSILVLIGTTGKHPGWVVFFAIAVLLWTG